MHRTVQNSRCTCEGSSMCARSPAAMQMPRSRPTVSKSWRRLQRACIDTHLRVQQAVKPQILQALARRRCGWGSRGRLHQHGLAPGGKAGAQGIPVRWRVTQPAAAAWLHGGSRSWLLAADQRCAQHLLPPAGMHTHKVKAVSL